MKLIKLFEEILNGNSPEVKTLKQIEEMKKRKKFLKKLGLSPNHRIRF